MTFFVPMWILWTLAVIGGLLILGFAAVTIMYFLALHQFAKMGAAFMKGFFR